MLLVSFFYKREVFAEEFRKFVRYLQQKQKQCIWNGLIIT